jgi:hypothetical protein
MSPSAERERERDRERERERESDAGLRSPTILEVLTTQRASPRDVDLPGEQSVILKLERESVLE